MLLAQGAPQVEPLFSRHGCVVPLKALEAAEGAVCSGVVPAGLVGCCSKPTTNSEIPICWQMNISPYENHFKFLLFQ